MIGKPKPGTMPMQSALTRALAMVAALVVAVSMATVFVAGALLLKRYAHKNFDHVAWQASYAAEVAVVFNNHVAAEEAIRSAADLEGVRAITVRDASGRVMANALRDGLSADDLAEGWFDPRSVRHAIVNGGIRIGEVIVRGQTTGISALF